MGDSNQAPGSSSITTLWAPPSYGEFTADAFGVFRFFLEDDGCVAGLAMHQEATPGRKGVTRLTWANHASVHAPLFQALTTFAQGNVDAKTAFLWLTHVEGVTWGDFHSESSRGIRLTMADIDRARAWAQGFTDDVSWAYGAELPSRRGSASSVDRAGLDTPAEGGLIPDDGSWLLIDSTSGWTLDAGSSRLVPALVGDEADIMFAPESVEDRMEYAHQVGTRLMLPSSAGTPLSDLGARYWLVSGDNGDYLLDVADVVLIEATGDGGFDNTEEGCELALRCVEDQRRVGTPVVSLLPDTAC